MIVAKHVYGLLNDKLVKLSTGEILKTIDSVISAFDIEPLAITDELGNVIERKQVFGSLKVELDKMIESDKKKDNRSSNYC